jgi:hypothetical protein
VVWALIALVALKWIPQHRDVEVWMKQSIFFWNSDHKYQFCFSIDGFSVEWPMPSVILILSRSKISCSFCFWFFTGMMLQACSHKDPGLKWSMQKILTLACCWTTVSWKWQWDLENMKFMLIWLFEFLYPVSRYHNLEFLLSTKVTYVRIRLRLNHSSACSAENML